MGRPVAYEYIGYVYKGQTYPVYRDDQDPDLRYVVPPTMRVARDDSNKPKANVAICESIQVPSAKGLGMMVPYLPAGLEEALKKEYNARIAPLPVSSAGQVIALGADWYIEGVAAEEAWKVDNTSFEGMDPKVVAELKKAKLLWDTRRVRTPLRKIVGDEGYFLQVPTLVGSNIGAEIPFNFGVFGADNVKEFQALLKGGGILNGEVVYYYVGTTRPWAIQVHADISKVHSYMSEAFSVGRWFARADVYRAVEQMKQRSIIEFTVWDENDNVTTKYKPEKIFDLLLTKILDKVFDFHQDMKPETGQAEAKAERWWWWSGAYARRSSSVDVSEIIDVKIRINGRSEPIPVSIGYYIDIPKGNIHSCDEFSYVDEWQDQIIAAAYEASPAQLKQMHSAFMQMLDASKRG